MHALASILAKPLSGNTSDRLMSRQRLDEVCAVLRKASEGYSSTERTLAAVNIIREWFAEAGMAHGSEMALSGAAGEDAAAELLLSVAVIDTLGPVFEQRFQGVTAATSVKAAEA